MAAAGSPLGPTNFPPCYLTAQTGSGVLGARSIALPKGDEKRAKSDTNYEAIGDVAGRSLFTRRTSHQHLSVPREIHSKDMQPHAVGRPHTAHPTGNSPSLQLGALSRKASFGNSGRSFSTPDAVAEVKTTLDKLAQLRADQSTPFGNSAFSEYPRGVDTIPEQDSPPPTTSRTIGSSVISPASTSGHCFSRPLAHISNRCINDSPAESVDSNGTAERDVLQLNLENGLSPSTFRDSVSPCTDAPDKAQIECTREEFRQALTSFFQFAEDLKVREIQKKAFQEPLSSEDLDLMVRWFVDKKGSDRLKLAQRDFKNVPKIYARFIENLDLFSQVKDFLPLRLAVGVERIDLTPPIKDFITEAEIQDFLDKYGQEKSSVKTPPSREIEELKDVDGIPRYGSERGLPPVDYKLTGDESVADVLDKYPVKQRQYLGERLDKEKPLNT